MFYTCVFKGYFWNLNNAPPPQKKKMLRFWNQEVLLNIHLNDIMHLKSLSKYCVAKNHTPEVCKHVNCFASWQWRTGLLRLGLFAFLTSMNLTCVSNPRKYRSNSSVVRMLSRKFLHGDSDEESSVIWSCVRMYRTRFWCLTQI